MLRPHSRLTAAAEVATSGHTLLASTGDTTSPTVQMRTPRHRESQNFPGLCDSQAPGSPAPEREVCWPQLWATRPLNLVISFSHLLLIATGHSQPAQRAEGPPTLPQRSCPLPRVTRFSGPRGSLPPAPAPVSVPGPIRHQTPSQPRAAVTGTESSLSSQGGEGLASGSPVLK